MLYHASPIGGLTELRPHISNHGIPLLYFSQKRENTFVYLSNAVEKYCRETRGAVEATGCEFIPDAWEAILQAEQEGLLVLRRYEEMTEREADWLRRTVREEYRQAEDHPEYQHFLRDKFGIDPESL